MEKKIAILFMSNRFSQKIGKRVSVCWDNTNYATEPINMRKIINPRTIINKLKDYDYVLIHFSDIDLIEKLTDLKINFCILKREYDEKHRLRFDDTYLKIQIKKMLGAIVKQKVYRIDDTNNIIEIERTIDKILDKDYYFDSPQEAYENKINELDEYIDRYKKWMEYYCIQKQKLKENCKDKLKEL